MRKKTIISGLLTPVRQFFPKVLISEEPIKCSKYKRKFKMQQRQSKIIHKIQNESSILSIIVAVIDISVASDFMTRQ
jgi:hypothetical protein